MVEVDGQPIQTHCFDLLVDLRAEDLIVVVDYLKEGIFSQ
jgi:glucose-1-phosphate thymidylyltransferase